MVRYAVVGLGHIAQVAMIPAFAHARRNSKLVAIVSGDRTKRREIAKRYRIDHAFGYDDYDRGDIRTKHAYGGGTLYDIGVYCINAARNLFRAAGVGAYRIVGTRGDIHANPAYEYAEGLEFRRPVRP